MASPMSLKMQILTRCYPGEIYSMAIYIQENYGIDLLSSINASFAPYGITLEDMDRINRNYDGWWGLPSPIMRFTLEPYWLDPEFN